MKQTIWIGFDGREVDAYFVARQSIARRLTMPITARPIVLSDLQESGLYQRPTKIETRDGRRRLLDLLSARADYDGSISTEFAISRFFLPWITGAAGHPDGNLALFMDSDVLARGNLARLFEEAERDPGRAVYCVKHDHQPTGTVKMDGQVQTQYARKNWSSVFVMDLNHPANKALTVEALNTLPGRDLHRFCWLDDAEIGDLSPTWNYLVGHSVGVPDPQLVHFTDGVPSMPGYEHCEFAGEWRAELRRAL